MAQKRRTPTVVDGNTTYQSLSSGKSGGRVVVVGGWVNRLRNFAENATRSVYMIYTLGLYDKYSYFFLNKNAFKYNFLNVST